MDIDIRPATAADIESLCGQRSKQTIRALSFFKGDELVAIAGVTIERHKPVAFSDIKPGVEVPKLTVWRCAKEVMKFIEQSNVPVIAGPSENYPNAGRFLERLGFYYVGTGTEGDVYEWS